MNKTAIKMLALGVAVLGVLGGALNIKNTTYAEESAAKVSEETLGELDAAMQNLLEKASAALKEANPDAEEPDPTEGAVAALGASESVPAKSGMNPAPFIIIFLSLFGSISIVVTAFMKQYHPVTREASVAEAVDQIVSRRQRRADQPQKPSRDEDRFEAISRAVDEIVARQQDSRE